MTIKALIFFTKRLVVISLVLVCRFGSSPLLKMDGSKSYRFFCLATGVGIVKQLAANDPVMSHMQAIWLVFLISLVLTLFVAVVMYLFIERPMMNLRK